MRVHLSAACRSVVVIVAHNNRVSHLTYACCCQCYCGLLVMWTCCHRLRTTKAAAPHHEYIHTYIHINMLHFPAVANVHLFSQQPWPWPSPRSRPKLPATIASAAAAVCGRSRFSLQHSLMRWIMHGMRSGQNAEKHTNNNKHTTKNIYK